MADFTDLRSSSRAGHCRGRPTWAATAAGLYGLPDRQIVNLRRERPKLPPAQPWWGRRGIPPPEVG